MLLTDEQVLGPVGRQEPALGFDDDPVGKREVRRVPALPLGDPVVDHEGLVLAPDSGSPQAIGDTLF